MADYTILSDISSYLVKVLRECMCPEPIPTPNRIEAFSPTEQESDYVLGLHLYDLQEDGEISRAQMMQAGFQRMRRPPKPYSLSYMLFLNGSAQTGMKAFEAQKVIGCAAQIMGDLGAVMPAVLQPWLEIPEPPILFNANKLPLEEKIKVWQAMNKPFQLSLFYKVSPVFISSHIVFDVPRVTDAAFGVHFIGDPDAPPRETKR